MRLKEDKSSWRANAIVKRDFRHDHNDLLLSVRSHKNTNKWCRGKVGITHSISWHRETGFFGGRYKLGKCVNCGKHMFSRI
ncbi:MAG TPA: hypothetical protein VMR95_00985 [Candidatus Binatia bacterium]|nr:hypothetical protein [Candidatus Binatia bacterium]